MSECGDRFALFDDGHGGAIVLTGFRRVVAFSGAPFGESAHRLEAVFAEYESVLASGQWIALAADYALGACLDPALRARGAEACLRGWVFDRARRLDARALQGFLDEHLGALSEQARVAGVAELTPALDSEQHAAQVEQIRRWITDGDCYQINLTFPLTFKVYGDPLALYAGLRQRQPVGYGACIMTPEQSILSFSPELFFERRGSQVRTRPMKGTAARGRTPAADEAQRLALLASDKERAENVMIVDLLRNDLGRLAAPGKVRVDTLCEAESYPTLWQMVSAVSAELPEVRLLDLFRALFPCGSITGAPKIRAMQRIKELEPHARGLYTGALGWLAPEGRCRLNVAIRTLVVAPDGQGSLGVGSGIVIDSEPAQEYAECLLKARFLSAFDPGFELVETMRLENGVFPLVALHRARLKESARALGFALDLCAIDAELAEVASLCAPGVFRVRLTLAHNGRHTLSTAPLADAVRSWRVALASQRLPPGDYLRRHKTTARHLYNGVLAQLAGTPEVFDAFFLNTRGEVCEGARSNVFIERDGLLLTPPLCCGLLAGVMRRQLLDEGRARECVLTVDDLRRAPAIYAGNALRGLIRVELQV